MTNKIWKQTDQSGRSMIEMLGVLAIVGVLSVGGIAGYSKAMGKFRVGKTIDQIQTIVSATRSLFATEAGYSSLTSVTNAIDLQIIPKDMIDPADATKAISAFGGQVEMAGVAGTTNFTLTFKGLPKDICTEIAVSDFGISNQTSGFFSIKVNDSDAWEWGDPADTHHMLKLSAVTVLGECDEDDNGNQVLWTFR